jgi:hypothetical protein
MRIDPNVRIRILRRPNRRDGLAGAVLALLAVSLTAARGQEAVRMSIASEQAAEARRKAATSVGYYNLQLGPTAWNFTAGLGMDYNSNVYLTEDNPQGDFILSPQINTRMQWPVSDQNSINLVLGGGYQAYVINPNLDRVFITPDSELSFDLYAGDFWINLHDRFSILENTYQDPTVVGSGNYSQLQNALGVATVWDLNKGIVKFGYDHVNYDSLNSDSSQSYGGQPSGYSEVFSTSAGYALKPGMLLGLELGGSLITYTTTTTNTPYSSANQWNVGGFYDAPLTEYIHVTAHAGYTEYLPESGGTTTTGGDFTGIYGQLDITHRLNQYVAYTLSAGRSIDGAYYGGAIDRYFVHWQADWRILQKLTLGTSFSFENGTQLVVGGETYDQYGPGISLSRPITAKLTGTLSYQPYWRTSNLSGRSYTLQVVSLRLNYTF